MNDPEAIKRLVENARRQAASDKQMQQAQAEASNSGGSRGQAAAAQLLGELAGWLTKICMQSAGAMHWGSEAVAAGGEEFELRWVDPLPARTLSIVVENAGVVLWGWFGERLRPSYTRMNAAGFTEAFLMDLVVALADQAAWEDGREPEVQVRPLSP